MILGILFVLVLVYLLVLIGLYLDLKNRLIVRNGISKHFETSYFELLSVIRESGFSVDFKEVPQTKYVKTLVKIKNK